MDFTAAFRIVLEQSGYTDIQIESATPPKHVLRWAKGDDKDTTDKEVAEVMPYYRVSSVQGCFGIVMGAYLLLDLANTGYNARDLGDTEATDNLFLTSFNSLTIQRLNHLLKTPRQ